MSSPQAQPVIEQQQQQPEPTQEAASPETRSEPQPEEPAANPAQSSVSKGKRKATEEDEEDDDDDESEDGSDHGEEPQWHHEGQQDAEPALPKGVKPVEEEVQRPKAGDWEAIWSAQCVAKRIACGALCLSQAKLPVLNRRHNAYYFHNTKTQETTWTNPMTAEGQAQQQQKNEQQRPVNAEDYGGVDPELAYLDPSLRSAGAASSAEFTGTTARFNARTGKFEGGRAGNRKPEHHSDQSRARRQSSFFFDVKTWEKVSERAHCVH